MNKTCALRNAIPTNLKQASHQVDSLSLRKFHVIEMIYFLTFQNTCFCGMEQTILQVPKGLLVPVKPVHWIFVCKQAKIQWVIWVA